MMNASFTRSPSSASEPFSLDSEVIELPVLLPRWQVQALESVAQREGLTTAQVLRQVIGAVLSAGLAK